MNHLAHLVLAGDDPAMLVGGFLGDYVKGRLNDDLPHGVTRGIRLHRAIDAYTDSHPAVRLSQQRFEPPYRRYSGIILDIMFDHLLARSWRTFYDMELEDFSRWALTVLVDRAGELPDRAAHSARRMHAFNSLSNHGDDQFLINSFTHLGTRLTRDNPLDSAFELCQLKKKVIGQDFLDFYPELINFCETWKIENP